MWGRPIRKPGSAAVLLDNHRPKGTVILSSAIGLRLRTVRRSLERAAM
jgi:hypothetical protein